MTRPDVKVHVSSVRGSQMAAKVGGKFEVGGHEFRFTAIAFGRIGGQNVGAKLSAETERRLAALGHDPDEVVMELQARLVRGEITVPEGLKKESFADG